MCHGEGTRTLIAPCPAAQGVAPGSFGGFRNSTVLFFTPVTADTCATGVHISVPLRSGRGGTKRPGTKTITHSALTSSGTADRDSVTLACKP